MNSLLAATSTTAMSGEGVYNYGLVIFLMMTGLYLVLAKGNMIKSIIGLNIFQVSVIMFYVSMGRVEHGTAPILLDDDLPHHLESQETDHGEGDHGMLQTGSEVALASTDAAHSSGSHSPKKDTTQSVTTTESTVYSNPLPHVLMLTAIVVGVATTALALALVVRIREYYDTIEEDLVDAIESRLQQEEQAEVQS